MEANEQQLKAAREQIAKLHHDNEERKREYLDTIKAQFGEKATVATAVIVMTYNAMTELLAMTDHRYAETGKVLELTARCKTAHTAGSTLLLEHALDNDKDRCAALGKLISNMLDLQMDYLRTVDQLSMELALGEHKGPMQ
jgi:hypothetical protein